AKRRAPSSMSVHRSQNEANGSDDGILANHDTAGEVLVSEVGSTDVTVNDLLGVYLLTQPLPPLVLHSSGLELVHAAIYRNRILVQEECVNLIGPFRPRCINDFSGHEPTF